MIESTIHVDLPSFLPELVICGTIFAMLLLRVTKAGRKLDAFYLAIAGTLVALYYAAPWRLLDEQTEIVRQELFTGMLLYDGFTVFIRSLLLLFVLLFACFTKLSGIPDKNDSADFYCLILGSTLGMCLMASANHLLMVFLAVEMASVPSYALAGLLKTRRKASEAALKYSIYGAGTAGIMLYGISLIAGVLNTAHLPTAAVQLALGLAEMTNQEYMVLAMGGLMLGVGLAFKLSAFPFHFWCPDVFEGATSEVNAFLSIASKTAAMALLIRVAIGFGTVHPGEQSVEQAVPQQAEAPLEVSSPPVESQLTEATTPPVLLISETIAHDEHGSHEGHDHDHGSHEGHDHDHDHDHGSHEGHSHEEPDHGSSSESTAESTDEAHAESTTEGAEESSEHASTPGLLPTSEPTTPHMMENLAPVRRFIALLIALVAVVTCTFGNMAAYGQTNIKRLMAYSTIAHAGYMMMAVPAIMAMAQTNPSGAQSGVAAVGLYLSIYLFMNLGAFAIIAFLRNAMGSEEIADYAGLLKRCPTMAICFSAILFSLVGLPPLAGFVGKFAIFASLVEAYKSASLAGVSGTYLMILLVVGGINTAISLFYYLRVVKTMTIESEPADRAPFEFPAVSLPGFYTLLLTAPSLLLFFFWEPLSQMALSAAAQLLS